MYFRNYRLSKTWLDQSLKSAVSEHPLIVNMLKSPKHLCNLDERHVFSSCLFIMRDMSFYHVFSSLWGELISKKCSLVKFEILGVFVSTVTVDDKDPLPDFENLRLQIQMQLSLKRKPFFLFFIQFLESISNS